VLNSTVSTTMLEKMARAYGVEFRETLTGFKWMGNIAKDLEEDGYEVPFAFEEALGYMFPKVSYDKDGITAAAVFLLAEAQWRTQGLTPFTKLHRLFKRFGHHETFNNYFRSPDPATTAALFAKIRAGPWRRGKAFGKHKITRWRDMTLGYDSDTPDHKPALPVDPTSHMLTVWLNSDVKFTLRGSGTEPKVKCESSFPHVHSKTQTDVLFVLPVYIESWKNDQDLAIETVCDVFTTILKKWIRAFAPSMTYKDEFFTSSSHNHVVTD
jgi:phosphoglucomutase